jgi:hypothetical protein
LLKNLLNKTIKSLYYRKNNRKLKPLLELKKLLKKYIRNHILMLMLKNIIQKERLHQKNNIIITKNKLNKFMLFLKLLMSNNLFNKLLKKLPLKNQKKNHTKKKLKVVRKKLLPKRLRKFRKKNKPKNQEKLPRNILKKLQKPKRIN